MTFNLFPSLPGSAATNLARTVWQDVRDPARLARQEKLFCIENIGYTRTLCFCVGQSPWDRDVLPVEIPTGAGVKRTMIVGDDIRARREDVQELRLRICLAALPAAENVSVHWNGTVLDATREDGSWLAADVPPTCMRQGSNQLAVGRGQGSAPPLTLRAAELRVRYSSE